MLFPFIPRRVHAPLYEVKISNSLEIRTKNVLFHIVRANLRATRLT